jgi:tripartite-type tricarboxylate transporter receptor subunit TctC
MFPSALPRSLRTGLAALLLTLGAAASAAYPDRPIRIVVGFPPGQATDLVARIMARKLQDVLAQPVFVENKPGASGIIGTEQVVKAAPDGYTLLMGSSGTLAINPSLYSKLSYKPLADLTPISQIANVPLFLAVNKDFPAHNASEFVSLVKAQPGKLSYGSAGSGVTSHLTMELLKQQLGLFIVHVPYKGSPAAVTDLISGQVQAMVDTGPALLQHHRGGKIRVLAVASANRNDAARDVPTMAEAGVGKFEAPAWLALMAPKGTPKEVVDTLYAALAKVWREPDVKEQLAAIGSEPLLTRPDELARHIDEEIKRWAVAVKVSGARVD